MKQVREWERIDSNTVGDYDVFRVRRTRARSPRTGEVHVFHVLDVPCCVQVIPITEDGRVVMVEQYRQGVQRVTLEFPAGVVQQGEDPLRAALRELEEETGYRAGDAAVLIEFDPDPALHANTVQVIVARNCTADGARNQDEAEDVAVRLVSPDQIDALIRDGSIRHAVAIGAWYLYQSTRG